MDARGRGRWGFSFDIMRMFSVRFYDMSDRSNGYWRCCNVNIMLYVLFYNACTTQILCGFHIKDQNTIYFKVFDKKEKLYYISHHAAINRIFASYEGAD